MPALSPARRDPINLPITPTERQGLRLHFINLKDDLGRLIRQLDRGDRALTVDGPLQAAALLNAVEAGEPGKTMPVLRTKVRTLFARGER